MRRTLAALIALFALFAPATASAQSAAIGLMPDDGAMPWGFVRQGADTVTPDSVDRFYFNDAGGMIRLAAIRRDTEGEALETCHTRATTMAGQGWLVSPTTIDGRQGFTAFRVQGISQGRAAYVVAGSDCLGLIGEGATGTIPVAHLPTILRDMISRAI